MALVFFDTATRQKRAFEPVEGKCVKMYVCGPTVYDRFHIGNARAFMIFDTLRRVLEYLGYQVIYIQNITDVDDKIIQRANKEGKTAQEVAQEFTRAFEEDIKALGCKPASIYPKATEHIQEITDLIQRLVQNGHAYALENGDVYFSVRSFPQYGRISGKNIEDLEQGARVEVDVRKKDPLDFALWKAAKPEENCSFPSPWGQGRPGWHIECSAMSMKYLGERFDIHGGGEDLVFPHHENENAQSESVTGRPLANFWLHNGFLKIDGEKMSKSLGNFKTFRGIMESALISSKKKVKEKEELSKYDDSYIRIYIKNIIRFFMLSAHYRSPLDFSFQSLKSAENGYDNIRRTIERLKEIIPNVETSELPETHATAEKLIAALKTAKQNFNGALEDDLNTAAAIGHLFELATHVQNTIGQRSSKVKLSAELYAAFKAAEEALAEMMEVLGIAHERPNVGDDIRSIIKIRNQKRTEKDWGAADQIRKELFDLGYDLEDTNFGVLCISIAPIPFNKIWAETNPNPLEKR